MDESEAALAVEVERIRNELRELPCRVKAGIRRGKRRKFVLLSSDEGPELALEARPATVLRIRQAAIVIAGVTFLIVSGWATSLPTVQKSINTGSISSVNSHVVPPRPLAPPPPSASPPLLIARPKAMPCSPLTLYDGSPPSPPPPHPQTPSSSQTPQTSPSPHPQAPPSPHPLASALLHLPPLPHRQSQHVAPMTLRPLFPPPPATAVELLNHRFEMGRPSNDPEAAGVFVRMLDHLTDTEDYGKAPWNPSRKPSRSDRFSGSVINRRTPAVFMGKFGR